MNILTFDLETVPDTETGRRLLGLDGLSEEGIARAMYTRQVQKSGGSDFLPLHLHRIVAISVVRQSGDKLLVRSLGEADSSEKTLIRNFYDCLEQYTPTLISWNGNGFDLPVLHYRSLYHQVTAPRYWENGDKEREFRYNNYLNRYHWRHIDLMDVLAGFSPRAFAPLDEISVMLGLPGKPSMRGSDVWETYLAGGIENIRNYCETDVLNTFLIYLKWEVVRGTLKLEEFEQQCEAVKTYLKQSAQPHLLEFLKAWQTTCPPLA